MSLTLHSAVSTYTLALKPKDTLCIFLNGQFNLKEKHELTPWGESKLELSTQRCFFILVTIGKGILNEIFQLPEKQVICFGRAHLK